VSDLPASIINPDFWLCCTICSAQTGSNADSIWHGGTCHPLLQMAGHGGTVSRKTVNKKLTKLHCPSQKRSPKRLIVLAEPKKLRGTTTKVRECAPHFQIRSGAIANRRFTHFQKTNNKIIYAQIVRSIARELAPF